LDQAIKNNKITNGNLIEETKLVLEMD